MHEAIIKSTEAINATRVLENGKHAYMSGSEVKSFGVDTTEELISFANKMLDITLTLKNRTDNG
ncbi:hypothetical protein OAD55_01035 [Planktomarina temperata]|nr:hypothetical protein [Planktomarina temperata]